MQVERRDVDGVTVVHLDGDLDGTGVDALRTVMYECVVEGRFQVVLDMSGVGFVSYMAVGVLVERLRKLRAFHGDMKLAGLNLHAERLFRMAGVRGLFEYFETEAQAVRRFREAA